jgi:transposase-like protein
MKRKTTSFGPSQRRAIVEEYLNSNSTKAAVWRKHTGEKQERGQLLRWMRQLGYLDNTVCEKIVPLDMAKEKRKQQSKAELEKRVRELENQLLDSQLKEEGYRRMIDIAEKDLKISIRKKPDTK